MWAIPASMADDSRNVSVQFQGAREIQDLDAYDEFIEEAEVFANRSEGIREAMKMQRDLFELLDELDRLPEAPVQARHAVRQALIDLIHAEDHAEAVENR